MNAPHTQTAIATLVAANIGRHIEATPKGESQPKIYKISRLANKMGTLKSGEKGEYVVISQTDAEDTVVSLHPNIVKELFDKGVSSGYKLLAPQVGATAAIHGGDAVMTEANATPPDENEQDQLNAELEASQKVGAGEGETGTPPAPTTAASGKKTKAEKEAEKVAAKTAREADRKAKKEAKDAEKAAAKEGKAADAKPSKKDQAVAIYKSEPDGDDKRKRVIARFKAEIEDENGNKDVMSANACNTYYQNCKSGLWS